MNRLAAVLALAVVEALASASASAQTVSMSGNFGSNALLVIDGKPRNVAVGATVEGVRLLSLANNVAVVEVKGGQRVTLRLGDAQINLGGKSSEGGGKQIVLTAQSGGHFYSAGTINGKAVRFMVDTGATNIAMDRYEADRLGVDWKSGRRDMVRTANGDAPVSMLSLPSVRVGDVVVYNVPAVISPSPMPYILLGNSFLSRFQMKRDNDVMTLDLRY